MVGCMAAFFQPSPKLSVLFYKIGFYFQAYGDKLINFQQYGIYYTYT